MTDSDTRPATGTLPALLTLPGDQQADLARAVATLEGPSVAARIAGVVGTSVEALKARLPGQLRDGVDGAVRRALEQSWRTAVSTEPRKTPFGMSPAWFHRGLIAATGAAGGALGFIGTLAELPISTTLMLRQIAAEAAAAGEDPKVAITAAQCLSVFALGSPATAEDDPAEAGYFAARLALAQLLPNAATSLTSSILPGFLGAIAGRFTGAMGLKLSAQAVPVVGAATGAAINLVFMDHFQSTAWAHFTVRRLERQYGEDRIASAYKALRDGTAA